MLDSAGRGIGGKTTFGLSYWKVRQFEGLKSQDFTLLALYKISSACNFCTCERSKPRQIQTTEQF